MLFANRIERRRYKRLNVCLSALCRIAGPAKLLYLLEGKEFEANVVNISLGGAALEVPMELPEGTRLFIKMVVFETDYKGRADFYEVMTLFGNIRHSVETEEGKFRLGMYFTDMDEDRIKSLQNLLRSSLKRQDEPARPTSGMPTILFSK